MKQTQRTIDFRDGPRLRDEALFAVEKHADSAWKAAAHAAVAKCADLFDQFSTDEVWGVVARSGAWTRERRAMGAIMVAAINKGLIERIGWRPSSNPACHCRPKTLYRKRTA